VRVDVLREQGEHHTVMPAAVCLAMRTQQTFSLKAGPFDCTDRGLVVCRRLGEHTMEAKLPQTPGRPKPHGFRGDAPSSGPREDRNGEARNLCVFAELQVEQPERTVVGRICDHERRPATRAPLFPGARNAFSLSSWRQRLVVQSTASLGVVRRFRDQRNIVVSPQS
jgi:hypothetical protein